MAWPGGEAFLGGQRKLAVIRFHHSPDFEDVEAGKTAHHSEEVEEQSYIISP
jgi:hypothetical protein